jgi:hypothetical protein
VNGTSIALGASGTLVTDDIAEDGTPVNLWFTNTRARTAVSATDAGGDGSFSYDSGTGVFTYTGPSATEVRTHFTAGTGLTYTTGQFAIDSTVATLTGSQTLTNKTISGADNTLSNIGNSSLTNSSITINGGSVSLGGTRTLVTDDIAEDGSPANLWYTDTRSRAAISVTDAGGDGSLSYNSGSGVITYTGPSAEEVRAHFSAGTGVSISSGQVSIGQAVATTDNVTFAGVTADNIRVGVTGANEIDTSSGNLTIDSTGGTTVMDDDVNVTGNLLVDGNLTVSGTTVTVNTTNLAVEDNMIYLNNGSAVTNPDLGFAGNYNDGTYRHAGVFRDASDGVWKFFHQYTPEPDASPYIDITHGSFALAPVQASSFTGSLTGNVTGNASTATAWATARTLTLSGDVTGTSAAFDGSGNISITTTIAADSVALGTDTTGDYVASVAVAGTGLSVSGSGENATYTITSNATSANTASTIVARDASGNFTAGTITAALSGNATTATTLQTARNINGVSFNGSADITVADSTKLPLAGGTMTAGLLFNATATSGPGNGTPTALSYGRLQGYGDFFINADTDLSGTEFVYITAGKAQGSTDGLRIGQTVGTLTWMTNAVLHAGNYNSYALPISGGTLTGGRPIELNPTNGLIAFNADAGGWAMGTYFKGSGGTYLAGFGAYGGSDALTYAWIGPAYNSPWLTLNGSAITSTVQSSFTGGGSNANVVLDKNIASPANYYNGLQLEVRATSGTAGIGLHRNGYSHVGIYHNTSNVLQFQMNAGTVTMNYDAGTLIGTGNYNSYSPTLTGTGASGTWSINVTGTAGSISGFNNPTAASTANTIAYRTSLGDIAVRELILEVGVQSFTPSSMVAIYPTTNQAVKVDAAGARNFLDVPTRSGGNASGTWGINITGSASSSTSASYARYFPTNYIGGQQLNPQTYFNNGVGLNVAMTGAVGYWTDTLWINGYSGGDVLSMCALHTSRNGAPTMWISTQQSTATSYGTFYEFLTAYNYTNYSPSLTGGGASGNWSINSSTATILKSVNTTTSTTSTWNPQSLTYQAWGQGFAHSSISGDTGDIVMWLRASQYSGGGTELCMIIDGDYFAGTGQHKVLHAGNYNSYSPTLTGTGASGTWSINITGNAATLGNLALGTSTSTVAYWNSSRNLVVYNPEAYSGEVRVGAAWDRGGIYGSNGVSVATGNGLFIDHVHNNTTTARHVYDANGSRFILGTNQTTTPHTLIDTNQRPVMYLRGQYPVLVLDHTATSNTNHGPTIQFAHNGLGARQWLIGTSGDGTKFDMGFSSSDFSNTDYNPHNGIAGYAGVTFMTVRTNGRMGFGWAGDWGAYGAYTSGPDYPFHFVSAKHQNSHSVLFRNDNNGGAGDGNGAGAIFVNTRGDHSWGVVAEFRVDQGAGYDKPSILFSQGNNSNTFTVGFGYNDADYFRINRDHGHRNSSWGTTLMLLDRSGNVTFTGNVTAYSDQRLKKNVTKIENALALVQQLEGVTFDYIEDNRPGLGMIAQEVEKILPVLVGEAPATNGITYKNIAYGNVVAVLIEAIKEQQKQIDELKNSRGIQS